MWPSWFYFCIMNRRVEESRVMYKWSSKQTNSPPDPCSCWLIVYRSRTSGTRCHSVTVVRFFKTMDPPREKKPHQGQACRPDISTPSCKSLPGIEMPPLPLRKKSKELLFTELVTALFRFCFANYPYPQCNSTGNKSGLKCLKFLESFPFEC